MSWSFRRRRLLCDFQLSRDSKYLTGNFVLDVCGYLVITDRIGFVKADGHACSAKLDESLLHRLSGPDWAATCRRFASIWSFEEEVRNYIADALRIWGTTMKNEKCSIPSRRDVGC